MKADLSQMAIAAMADGLVLYASDGSVQHINPAARELFGLPGDADNATIDERLRGLLESDGTPITPEQQPTAHALRGEAVRHQALLVGGPNHRPVTASAIPLRGADGRLEGVVATFADATQLRQLKAQRDDLISMVSHDLRTPLSALLMQAQMLQRSLPPDDRSAKRVNTIIANGQRLANMIRDLVELVRMESGQFQLGHKPVDVQAFVTAMVERRAADLAKDRIELSFAADLPSLSADPDRLERILVHLLSNALKYSDPPSKVLLHAGCADGFVTLAVTDHGVGISRRDLPQLFERSSEPRPGSRQESLGIGLTITELLVRAHGGRIEVESELGKGSVFRVYLPVDGSASCPTPAA